MTSAIRWITPWMLLGTAVTAQQQTQPADSVTLTVDQAVALAERNNPDYLQTLARHRSAAAAVVHSYGALLPSVSSSLGGQYQQGGRQIVNGSSLGASSDLLQSSYSFGVNYSLDLATVLGPRQQRAEATAVEADIANAREILRSTVRQNYLSVLQNQARAVLQDSLVQNANAQLELAQALEKVGAGTALDVQKAEVELGQQEGQRLQILNQLQIDKIRLLQEMGLPVDLRINLADTFVFDTQVPVLSELLQIARQSNPTIDALRSREHVADVGVKQQWSEYFPALSASTGISGYTAQYRDPNYLVQQAQVAGAGAQASCIEQQDIRAAAGLPNDPSACAGLTVSDAEAAVIRSGNRKFPFSFTQSPFNVSVGLSLSIFDGLGRRQRRQEALIRQEDARYARRSRELAVDADVTTAYLSLETARRTVVLQTKVSAKARQELELVQDQYKVGAATSVELSAARASYAQVENNRITGLYDYHKAITVLENSVGRPLR